MYVYALQDGSATLAWIEALGNMGCILAMLPAIISLCCTLELYLYVQCVYVLLVVAHSILYLSLK